SLTSATRISGLCLRALARRSSRVPSLGLAGGSDLVSGLAVWAFAEFAAQIARARLTVHLHIAFLLLSGLFQADEQPVIVGGNGQLLRGRSVEGLAVAAQGALKIVVVGEITVAGFEEQGGAVAGAVEGLPLFGDRRRHGIALGDFPGRGRFLLKTRLGDGQPRVAVRFRRGRA